MIAAGIGRGVEVLRRTSLLTALAAFWFGMAAGSGCAEDDEPDNPLICNAASCACGMDEECSISPEECGDGGSCSLDCSEGSVCEGSCGESCSLDCGPMATCDITVGKSGSVTCEDDSQCTVTCLDECSVSCGASATCEVQCPGDSEPQTVVEGMSCPAA